VIAPGVAGFVITVTEKVLTTLLPQPLFAFTVILNVPIVDPVVATIESAVELPVQPAGSVQL
jgi:hypothetical protein